VAQVRTRGFDGHGDLTGQLKSMFKSNLAIDFEAPHSSGWYWFVINQQFEVEAYILSLA
jgi:hypothetical protein